MVIAWGKWIQFFYKLVGPLIEVMGEAYPELMKAQPLIEQVIKQEEIQFSKTLKKVLIF